MNVLIIGYGSIGRRHAEILSKFVEVTSIHLITHQNVKEYKAYNNLNEVDLKNYDYFIISSETSKHYQQFIYIDKKVSGKKILIEKPIFSAYKVVKTNNEVFVGYNLRFHPVIQKLKGLLYNKVVHNVNIYTGSYLPNWRPGRDYKSIYSSSSDKGGGVLLDLSHEIDYSQWLFGAFETVSGVTDKVSKLEISANDYATFIAKTNRKVYMSITLDYFSKQEIRQIIVNTESSTIVADLISNQITIATIDKRKKKIGVEKADRNSSYLFMHQAILGNNYHDVADLKDGLRVLKYIEKVTNETK